MDLGTFPALAFTLLYHFAVLKQTVTELLKQLVNIEMEIKQKDDCFEILQR